MIDRDKSLGSILKQRRLAMGLTIHKLAIISDISLSHLGRIERGERFPSASILQKMAAPLGFEESELFSLAGYLSPLSVGLKEENAEYFGGHLDPYVRKVLATEPVEVQRAAIGILNMLKSIAKALKE